MPSPHDADELALRPMVNTVLGMQLDVLIVRYICFAEWVSDFASTFLHMFNGSHAGLDMLNFRSFIQIDDVIIESLAMAAHSIDSELWEARKKTGSLGRSDSYKRRLSDDEWDYISSEFGTDRLAKAKRAGIDPATGTRVKPYKQGPNDPALPPEQRAGYDAMGQRIMDRDQLGPSPDKPSPNRTLLSPMASVFEKKIPTIEAWESLGLEADVSQVVAAVKQSGGQILPGESYLKSYGIRKLKELRDKVTFEPNAPLDGREKKILATWSNLSSKNIVGDDDQMDEYPQELIVHPEHVYDALVKQGDQELAITMEEAEEQFAIEVRDELRSGTLPSPKQLSSRRGSRGMMSRWLGQKHKENEHGTQPDNLKGITQWLDSGGDPDEMPNAYLGFGRKYGNFDYAPDPKVMAMYKADNALWIDQIVKPACAMASKRMREIMNSAAASGGSWQPVALGKLIDPGADVSGQEGASFCGLASSEQGKAMLQRANEFLEDDGTSFPEIVQAVIKGLENSTNWVDKDTGETWMDVPDGRYHRAYWLALREFEKYRKKLLQRKSAEGGSSQAISQDGPIGSNTDVGGDKKTRADKKRNARAADAVQKVLDIGDDEVQAIVDRLSKLRDEAQPPADGGIESAEEKAQRQAAEMEMRELAAKLLAKIGDMDDKDAQRAKAAIAAMAG